MSIDWKQAMDPAERAKKVSWYRQRKGYNNN